MRLSRMKFSVPSALVTDRKRPPAKIAFLRSASASTVGWATTESASTFGVKSAGFALTTAVWTMSLE